MTDVLSLAEHEIEAGWRWVQHEAQALFHAVQPMLAEALNTFETAVIETLWGAAAALVKRLGLGLGLADLETALLNSLGLAGDGLLAAAQGLGSNLLQALLGLLQARVHGPIKAVA